MTIERDLIITIVNKGYSDYVVDAARDAGADWVVAEMDSPSMGLTPMECMKKSIDYMKTINY